MSCSSAGVLQQSRARVAEPVLAAQASNSSQRQARDVAGVRLVAAEARRAAQHAAQPQVLDRLEALRSRGRGGACSR